MRPARCRPGPQEAGPGHDALAAHRGPAKNRPKTGLPAGAGASLAWGKAPDTTQGPARDSGALEALRGPLCAAIAAALPALPPGLAARGGHDLAAPDAAASQSVATLPPRALCRPRPPRPAGAGETQVPAATRGKTFPRPNVFSGKNSSGG